jgi:hypothetical protein
MAKLLNYTGPGYPRRRQGQVVRMSSNPTTLSAAPRVPLARTRQVSAQSALITQIAWAWRNLLSEGMRVDWGQMAGAYEYQGANGFIGYTTGYNWYSAYCVIAYKTAFTGSFYVDTTVNFAYVVKGIYNAGCSVAAGSINVMFLTDSPAAFDDSGIVYVTAPPRPGRSVNWRSAQPVGGQVIDGTPIMIGSNYGYLMSYADPYAGTREVGSQWAIRAWYCASNFPFGNNFVYGTAA